MKEKPREELIQEIQILRERCQLFEDRARLFEETVRVFEERNQLLEEKVRIFEERIEELKRSRKLDSHNSSIPPSSEGLKKRITSLRPKGENKTGGQNGHQGHTLKQVKEPDEIVRISLKKCPSCLTNLEKIPTQSIVKRQVFDIPSIKAIVREYQVETKECPRCKCNRTARFPSHVNAPVQYGQCVQAFANYLKYQQLIPENRLQDIFKDFFNLPISTATISSFAVLLSEKLSASLDIIEKYLRGSPVKNVDETGFRIRGKTNWLHVLCNKDATYYRASEKRGAILEDLSGFVVHDHFKPYISRMNNADHVACNAHHLRELKALTELDHEEWAKKMSQILILGNNTKNTHRGKIPDMIIQRLSELYDNCIASGLAYHESQQPLKKKGNRGGHPKRRIGHNLLLRLKKHKEAVLRYLSQELVPFTNNQAEQDVRMMKVKQKISGGFRTQEGATLFCRIRSFLSTIRKQGGDALESIVKVLHGNTVPLFTS